MVSNRILSNIFWVGFGIVFITGGWYRLQNIDMTDLRFFVTYWPFYLFGSVLFAGAMYLGRNPND